MHTGLGLQFANLDRKVSDADVYRLELDLAARAEAAGFDSVWMSEHHFADYQLTSQTPMILSWLAGQTTRIKFGTMVTVLPWHDPLRVAEMFSVLDHLSGGRAVLGIGRGLGQKEFVGFRVAMGESRRRFTEYSAAILEALETGYMEYDGELYQQPRVEIRPAPLASFRGRTFASAVSPESMEIMARMGVGLMVIAQKPWETAEAELRGLPPALPRAQRDRGAQADPGRGGGRGRGPGRRPTTSADVYMQRWARSTVEHYEFANEGFADIEGYEYYGALAQEHRQARRGELRRLPGRPAGVGHARRGAPRSCSTTPSGPTPVAWWSPAFGGHAGRRGAQPAIELLATEVIPELKRHDVGGDLGVTYDTAGQLQPSVSMD